MAEGEGFEPPLPFRVKRFSRPPVSTTHTSLRKWQVFTLAHCTTTSAFASPVVVCILVCILTPAETPSLSNSADPPHRVHSFIGFAIAGDGRKSLLKYTSSRPRRSHPRAGDGRKSLLKYTTDQKTPMGQIAGDGRKSLLKYTEIDRGIELVKLGMAGSRCSSTLSFCIGTHGYSWGWPGVAAQVHSSKLSLISEWSWGWPGVAAQVHSLAVAPVVRLCWGWPGVAAQVHFKNL